MMEMRNEDPSAFQHFIRMSSAIFDYLVERLRPTLTKPITNLNPNLDPKPKVALTLLHLNMTTTYRNTQHAWRVSHNSIRYVVTDVVEVPSVKNKWTSSSGASPLNKADDNLQVWSSTGQKTFPTPLE